MADINGLFPSRWLKSADLDKAPNKRARVRMTHVEIEKIGDKKLPILYFQGTKKGLVLNVTNARMIEEITGSSETENWRGRWITLMVTKVEYQGKRVNGIRVDYPDNQTSAPAPALMRPAPPPEPEFDDGGGEFPDNATIGDVGMDDEEPPF